VGSLNQILQETARNIFNKIEKIDSVTFKQLCRQCGGKGFYLHQNYNMTTNKIDKQELLSCEVCEEGFIYGEKR